MTKTGVILINLGTPNTPTFSDVYRYLIEFLLDERVLDIPWLQRQLLVRGAIVPLRCRQSTSFYKKIWMKEGSPLKVYGQRIKEALQQLLGEDFVVELAMRYQQPSIPSVLKQMQKQSLQQLIIIPLFPQYASATTGSVHQKVMEEVKNWQVIPQLTFIDHFATHPAFIRAFAAQAASFSLNDYDHLLFSFHGLPQRQLKKANPHGCCLKTVDCCQSLSEKNASCYGAQCYATAKALAAELKLAPEQFSISFQSRLGKDPWIQPYTSDVLAQLVKAGKKRVLVFCPSFVCDCLETIHEISVEYAHEFKSAGGECLDLVPGLNDSPAWIQALQEITQGACCHL